MLLFYFPLSLFCSSFSFFFFSFFFPREKRLGWDSQFETAGFEGSWGCQENSKASKKTRVTCQPISWHNQEMGMGEQSGEMMAMGEEKKGRKRAGGGEREKKRAGERERERERRGRGGLMGGKGKADWIVGC